MPPKNALDHVVVGVPDLVSARSRLEALGFQVQADAHHPFGTGNCNVFFANGTYFEPLAVTDRDAEIAALKTINTFVRRFDAYRFRHGYGPMMAAFTTDSAERMAASFQEVGLGVAPIVSFTRDQAMPDGSMATIGVHLAVSISERAPDITLFCCEHLSRDILWQEERTVHPNGAKGIVRLIAVETNPTDYQYMFQTVTGDRDLRTTSSGIEMDVPNALINVVTPTAYTSLTGLTLEARGRGPRLEAAEMLVTDLAHVSARLEAQEIAFERRGEALIVPPTEAFALTLIVREG